MPTTPKQTVDPSVTLYRSLIGTPKQNITRVIEMMGGVERVIGKNDIVVIKPNVQWWNQGSPNLAAIKSFVDTIFAHPEGFEGEVVIAENCHRGAEPWQSAGWSNNFVRNGDLNGILNFNDLTGALKKQYGNRFSTIHWIDVDGGSRRVTSPADGTGYVYCDGTKGTLHLSMNNSAEGDDFREVVMTYPIFKTDKGTIVDYKNGIWRNNAYTEQPLRIVNFAALNHHSTYCGMTSAIKNYLGVSDLSGGPDPRSGGKLTDRYYNFHSFPFNKWAPGPTPGMIGAEIGMFMDTIRKPDLNITTAEWIGLASRLEPPVVRTRSVLASTDPVALDYHAAKYLLYPNSRIAFHNPEAPESPVYQYLKACADKSGYEFNETRVDVKSYDHKQQRMQNDDELVVLGKKQWGTHAKTIAKYMLFRYGSFLL